jgi:hypothetical protein
MEWRMGALREQKTCGRSGGKRYRQGQLTRKAATNTGPGPAPATTQQRSDCGVETNYLGCGNESSW